MGVLPDRTWHGTCRLLPSPTLPHTIANILPQNISAGQRPGQAAVCGDSRSAMVVPCVLSDQRPHSDTRSLQARTEIVYVRPAARSGHRNSVIGWATVLCNTTARAVRCNTTGRQTYTETATVLCNTAAAAVSHTQTTDTDCTVHTDTAPSHVQAPHAPIPSGNTALNVRGVRRRFPSVARFLSRHAVPILSASYRHRAGVRTRLLVSDRPASVPPARGRSVRPAGVVFVPTGL